jgi:hypothetical protein
MMHQLFEYIKGILCGTICGGIVLFVLDSVQIISVDLVLIPFLHGFLNWGYKNLGFSVIPFSLIIGNYSAKKMHLMSFFT